VDNGTSWSGWQGTLDLSAGTLESSGGTLNLDQFTTSANTAFKLSGNTEITSSDNMTFGTLDLGGNRLTLGEGSKGLTLPNTLTMDNASSAIETKNVYFTLGQALSLTSGSITSTGGTLTFTGGLTLGASGELDVSGSTLSTSGALDLGSGTFSSDNSSLDLQAATTLSANDQVTGQNPVTFEDVHFNGNVLTLGSASTHLKVNDALALSGIALETGAGSLTLSGALALTDNASLNSSGGTLTLGGTIDNSSELTYLELHWHCEVILRLPEH